MRTQKCHGRVIACVVGCTALILGLTGMSSAQAQARDLARQTLGTGDGWGSYGSGTTGGAAADAAHVYTVTDWAGFKAALADGGSAPKIIKVKGGIDADGPSWDSFAGPGYDFDAYLAATDPDGTARTAMADQMRSLL